jgi:signal transduction histidine kinase
MRARPRFGLSDRLLILAIVFIVITEVLVYVPSIANFRRNWLEDRIGQARTAALVLDAAPSGMVPENIARGVLQNIGAEAVAIKGEGSRRLLAQGNVPSAVHMEVDVRTPFDLSWVTDAFRTLLPHKPYLMRVIGPAPAGEDFVEIVLSDAELRRDMLHFSKNVLLLSLGISLAAVLLLYFTLDRLIVGPVRRLTVRMVRFGERPEDTSLIVVPSGRSDEIGIAERELSLMQRQLHAQLQQKSRLAALGLAVAKINHDLRNLLGSAQLILERITAVDDPVLQRWAPKLVSAVDRAIGLAESTLSYGKAQEPPPERSMVRLQAITAEVRDGLGLAGEGPIGWTESIERGLEIDADPDQLFRVLLNIARNAVQALEKRGTPDPARDQIRIVGRREGGTAVIEMSDTGPGIPARARETLFEPFGLSTSAGGTGLGLAIASDLVRAHGGTLQLVEGTLGATFRITIPDRPIELQAARTRRAG